MDIKIIKPDFDESVMAGEIKWRSRRGGLMK
jgi:hypothetical protein